MSTTQPTAHPGVPLSAAQRETLNTVLNLIIPASEDGRLPAAADYDVWGYICETANAQAGEIRDELDHADTRARTRLDRPLAQLSEGDARSVIDELRAEQPGFMQALARHTVCCYYQQDRVMQAIGMPVRPPFPEGYVVQPGDLSLLEPVRKRGKVYRDPAP